MSSDDFNLLRWILVMIVFGVFCGISLISGGGKYDEKNAPTMSGIDNTSTSTDFTRTTVSGNTTTAERLASNTSSKNFSSKNEKLTQENPKIQTKDKSPAKRDNAFLIATTTKSPKKYSVNGVNLTTIKLLDKLASSTKTPVAANKPSQGTAAFVNNNG